MQTLRLKLLQQPSRVDRLLHSLITSCAALSGSAHMVRDWADLPETLRSQIRQSERSGRSWECWVDGTDTWLFVACLSSDLSSQQASPVLEVCRFRGDGHLVENAPWVADATQRWRKLAI